MLFDILQYSFLARGFMAGIVIAIIAPFIGIFLVLRRYSLIADTLSHVSLAGIALGFLLNINPIISAVVVTALSSTIIERLRLSKKVYGESALALFLSGSLALAVVLISLKHGFNGNLLNYLFGSIVTVQNSDLYMISGLGVVIIALLLLFYKELVFITFDEEAAQVSGIPVRTINTVFILMAAVTIALAIPIIGILLISALIVIPVVSALQFRKGFQATIYIAEALSLLSVIVGIITSYYLTISTGGTIVLVALGLFLLSSLYPSLTKLIARTNR